MRKESLFILIEIGLIILIGFTFLVSALTEQDRNNLQSELNGLISDLDSSGYSWLSNFMIILLYLNINYVYNWGLKSIK